MSAGRKCIGDIFQPRNILESELFAYLDFLYQLSKGLHQYQEVPDSSTTFAEPSGINQKILEVDYLVTTLSSSSRYASVQCDFSAPSIKK